MPFLRGKRHPSFGPRARWEARGPSAAVYLSDWGKGAEIQGWNQMTF